MVTDKLYDEASGRISPAKQRGANDNGPCCKPEMFCFFIRSSPNVGKTPLLLFAGKSFACSACCLTPVTQSVGLSVVAFPLSKL